jgi:hypothetical protein
MKCPLREDIPSRWPPLSAVSASPATLPALNCCAQPGQ